MAKSLSLSDISITGPLGFPFFDCLGDEPVNISLNPFNVAFLLTPTDPGVVKLSELGDSSIGLILLLLDLVVLRVLLIRI